MISTYTDGVQEAQAEIARLQRQSTEIRGRPVDLTTSDAYTVQVDLHILGCRCTLLSVLARIIPPEADR
jgi:hypothetical protein